MSEENVRRLRELYSRWAEGNYSEMPDLFAEDISFEVVNPDGRTIVPRERMTTFWRDFLAQWEDFRTSAEEFVEAGDAVLVVERQRGIGKSSGVRTEATFYSVWTFREGRAVKVQWEMDRAKALKAAGLSE